MAGRVEDADRVEQRRLQVRDLESRVREAAEASSLYQLIDWSKGVFRFGTR